MINAHKTTVGDWSTVSDILGALESANVGVDTDGIEANATKLLFNQTVQSRIDFLGDEDYYRIDSLTPNGNDGVLTVEIESGHPIGLRLHLGK